MLTYHFNFEFQIAISTIIAAAGLFFTGWRIWADTIDRRRQRTMDHFKNIVNTPDKLKRDSDYEALYLDEEKFLKLLKEDQFIEWLIWHETFAGCILHKARFFDEELAKYFYSGPIINFWEKTHRLISMLRKHFKDDSAYRDIEKLAVKWAKEQDPDWDPANMMTSLH